MNAAPQAVAATAGFDVERLRADFPILQQEINGKPLVYLDNGASTQKPQAVIDAVSNFYAHDYANIHRGVHTLSERATAAYEGARDRVQRFLNAADRREIIFTSGTTEAINLVAQSFGGQKIGQGDEIILTGMEHHSNIVPWQLLAERVGATIKVVPITDDGALDLDAYTSLFGPRTRLVSLVHVSNALGTVNPVQAMVETAHAHDVPVLLDGAQAVAHTPVDVQALGCDFYAFSGHKIYGPSGIGVLYGRRELLEAMPPWQGGGDMITTVAFEGSTYAAPPYRFEAGTPHIAGVVGLAAALDYVDAVGLPSIAAYEHDLLDYATTAVGELPGLRLIGTAPEKAAILSFVFDGIHPHDIGTVLDFEGIAIRAGHHCAMPVMTRFGVAATARASFGIYNTRAEVDTLVQGLGKVREMFS
ncbi:MAG: cysteine desulfurase CsdA [Gammaproteobacteria bacterium]|nr:MAG: cysteine desulfurase CsdA [Gammaproteobacteria bacterium]